MSISIKKINKFYGKQHVLKDISFELKEGEITGFLGPNGAGKSTLMKILTCYLKPNSGTAKVAGFDILKNSKFVRKNIGYLPENNPLYLNLYIKEYLGFVANIYKLENPLEKIAQVIKATGLEKEQNKKIESLSKGYRQRVGLAQAIIHNPKVLILDEPTTGLDPNQIEEIRSLIKQICKNKTIILSTHIMQEVEAICDKVVIINKGKIVADELINNIPSVLKEKNKILLDIKFDKAIDINTISSIKGVLTVTSKTERQFIFEIENEQVQNEILQTVLKQGLNIQKIERITDSVESVFKTLTV